MLPKQNRANPAEINLVKEEGNLVSGSLFGLLVYNLADQRPPRFAFIVSNKLDKRATRRNQVKRALRSAVKPFLSQIKGKLFLFLAKKNILDKDSEIINKEVERVLEEIGIIDQAECQSASPCPPVASPPGDGRRVTDK